MIGEPLVRDDGTRISGAVRLPKQVTLEFEGSMNIFVLPSPVREHIAAFVLGMPIGTILITAVELARRAVVKYLNRH